jgi:hypothetical protein
MKHASPSFVLAALVLVPGCYANEGMMEADSGMVLLPDGGSSRNLAPWQDPNQASLPAASGSDVCPEMINLVEVHDYMPHIAAVHAAGCIHASPADVWAAVQDFQTSRQVEATNSVVLVTPAMESECPGGNYETQVNAGPSGFTVDFRLCWRHAVIDGTETAPTLTNTRWQKVWGSTAIRTLEGSLVTRPHPDDPANVTEVFYQYHLDAASLGPSNYETINSYVTAIYMRLVTRSHGMPLD